MSLYRRHTMLAQKQVEDNTPYIAGHSISKKNTTSTIRLGIVWISNVPIDANGWFKYDATNVTTISNLCRDTYEWDEIRLIGDWGEKQVDGAQFAYMSKNLVSVDFGNCVLTNCYSMFSSAEKIRIIKNLKIVTSEPNISYAFSSTRDLVNVDFYLSANNENANMNWFFGLTNSTTSVLKSVHLPTIPRQATVSNFFTNRESIENITSDNQYRSLDVCKVLSNLTLQSVLNLINAAQANITFTLHADVLAKCENEWAEAIEEALDNLYEAKGYDVFLTKY